MPRNPSKPTEENLQVEGKKRSWKLQKSWRKHEKIAQIERGKKTTNRSSHQKTNLVERKTRCKKMSSLKKNLHMQKKKKIGAKLKKQHLKFPSHRLRARKTRKSFMQADLVDTHDFQKPLHMVCTKSLTKISRKTFRKMTFEKHTNQSQRKSIKKFNLQKNF